MIHTPNPKYRFTAEGLCLLYAKIIAKNVEKVNVIISYECTRKSSPKDCSEFSIHNYANSEIIELTTLFQEV